MIGQYHKPPDMRYVDMCIYIDANLDKIVNVNEYPEIESKVYEYLYHILYALACKQNFFPHFDDYHLFALYGATELYISMRNKQKNAGQIVRGKEIVPIKSCLNFIKSVLFPLKVNYVRQNFGGVFNPEIGQDTEKLSENLKESVKAQYRRDLLFDIEDLLEDLPRKVRRIVWKTPYKLDDQLCQRMYISCMLTLLNDITLPNKLKNKMEKYRKSDDDKLLYTYKDNMNNVILWHLPEEMSDYIRLLVTIAKKEMSDDLNAARAENDLSDDVVSSIMKTAYATYDDTGDF